MKTQQSGILSNFTKTLLVVGLIFMFGFVFTGGFALGQVQGGLAFKNCHKGMFRRYACRCRNMDQLSHLAQKWIDTRYYTAETKPCNVDRIDKFWGYTFDNLKMPKGCEIQRMKLRMLITNKHQNDHLKVGVVEDPGGGTVAEWEYHSTLHAAGIPTNTTGFIDMTLSGAIVETVMEHGYLTVLVDDDSTVHGAVLSVWHG